MATRFYLPISGTPPLAALAVNSNWELTNSLVRLPCYTTKQNTALTNTNLTWPATSTQQWCWKQYQSKQLMAAYNWTTADTVSMVIGKCGEPSALTANTHLAYVVRVVSADGSVIRGVIGLYHATSTEFPNVASAATRIHSARVNGATNFSSQIGDRIIIEIGLHGVTPAAVSVQMRFGDPSGTSNFALTAGLTTDLCSWVELSRTVTLGTVWTQTLNDSVTMSENTPVKSARKPIADSVTMSENRTDIVAFLRTLTDAITMSDDRTDIATYIRLFADTVTISDELSKVLGRSKSLADSVEITDMLTKIWTKLQSLSDLVSISDSNIISVSKILSGETVSVSDSKSLAPHSVKSDTVSISDLLIKALQICRSLSENITMSDLLSKVFQANRTLADNTTITDNINKTSGIEKSDSVNVTDLLQKVWVVYKTLTKNITITDDISKQLNSVNADSVGISEGLLLLTGKLFGDSITALDNLNKAISTVRTDSVLIVDNIAKYSGQTKTDIANISDSYQKAIGLFKSDTAIIVDFMSYELGGGIGEDLYKLLNDSISISDFVSFVLSLIKADNVTISDSITRDIKPSKTDLITINDLLNKSAELFKSDNVTITDDLNIILNYSRTNNEFISVSEQLNKAIQKFLADTVLISDLANKSTRLFKTDNISISEYINLLISLNLSDNIIISDAVIKSIQAELSDTITLTDEQVRRLFIGYLYAPNGSVWAIEKLQAIIKKQVGEDKIFQWTDVDLLIPRDNEWQYIKME